MKSKTSGDLETKPSSATNAFAGIDGDIGGLAYQPNDPASVATALDRVDALIDTRAQLHLDDEAVPDAAKDLKRQYRLLIK